MVTVPSVTYRGKSTGVTIDEAHADLDEVLNGIVREHGPGAIGVFHGTGAFLDGLGSFTARRLKKELRTDHLYSTATVDAVAKTLVAEIHQNHKAINARVEALLA